MAYLTGFHAIEELIRSGKAKGPLLVANAGPRARTIMSLATDNKIRIDRVGEHELNRLAPGNRGIALHVEGKDQSNEMTVQDFLANLEEGQDALVVVLDGITDPHNYGAILRSCDQFGVDLVIVANRRSAKDAEVVSKTSAGAVAWVPIAIVPNLVRSVELCKEAGFWVYGADMKGEAVYEKDLRGRVVLIMGSEGSGISRLLKETCDGMVSIPTSGQVDSLNVSVAAGVLLYEARRQRH
uniref:23S rRNA (Guanosine(2251)-2'-O)-methyltransferase RlmB n=1 Tax=Gracilinema caldarium TaxID=215591 RepID=A0A7C3ICW1_9SPIR